LGTISFVTKQIKKINQELFGKNVAKKKEMIGTHGLFSFWDAKANKQKTVLSFPAIEAFTIIHQIHWPLFLSKSAVRKRKGLQRQ
jgi:hypothetical protein